MPHSVLDWVGVSVAAVAAVAVGTMLIAVRRDSKARQRLLNTGTRTDAVIVDLRPTQGERSKVGQYCDVLLELRTASGSPYRLTVGVIVANVDIPRYQPGSVISVYVDPADPTRVAAEDSEHYPERRHRTIARAGDPA